MPVARASRPLVIASASALLSGSEQTLPEPIFVTAVQGPSRYAQQRLLFCDVSSSEASRILSASCRAMPHSRREHVESGNAHDWYPEECCHAKDCAPVESWAFAQKVQTGSLPQLSVSTKHGTAIVPRNLPRRESKDNRMHACMRGWGNGSKQMVCIFF